MNGADRLCDTLLGNGIDVCFANPGTSEMHFVAALDRRPAMRCVLGLFEGVVTAAADGYARMAEKPAATLLHTGPGLANGLANLHNARRARTPMVNVVGDHAGYHLPYDAPLTSDIDSLARPMSHWLRRCAGPADVGPATEAAILAARSHPGVATLILPADAAWGEVGPAEIQPAVIPPPPAVPEERIAAAAEAIRRAGPRAGLLLRHDGLRADGLATAGRIAAATGAKLFSPVQIPRIEAGLGRVPVTRIPLAIDPALKCLGEVDVLVLVGAPEPVAFFAYPGKPSRLLHEGAPALLLAEPGEDIGAALEALADRLGARAPFDVVRPAALEGVPEGELTDAALSRSIAMLMPEGAIVVDEGLTTARSVFDLLKGAPPHDYLMLTGGAIGMGPGAAAGAALGAPGRKVVALQADGSGLYTVQGLWTQAREKLDVVTIVFSNRAYAILQREMRNLGVNEFGENAKRMMQLDDPAVDWVSLANGFGVEGAAVESAEGFHAVLDYALNRDGQGPFLIEAVMA
jgi:acetolactate synthase-1/2/3 large subunit